MDIAVLEFKDVPDIDPMIFGKSKDLKYGQEVFSICNSMGYGLSVSKGVISVPLVNVIYSGNERLMIQTDIGLNRGGSGGPLIDEHGNVVGMMTFRLTSNESNIQGISYAVPSDIIAGCLSSML